MLMRLALASNYAPDRRPLSEYGYHLASGLQAAASGDELVVLSGAYRSQHAAGVWRIWDHGSPHIPLQIVRAMRHQRADALLLNTHFTSWGSNRGNLAGLLTPWFARSAGFKVVTLLHHLPHTIDAQRIGYRLTPIHRVGIELACRALAMSNVVCFTLKRDLEFFKRRYKTAHTLHVPHGVLGRRSWRPPPGSGSVLAFGHWGRGKDPEPLLRAFTTACPDALGQVVIAGTSSHTRTGFQEELAAKYRSPRVTFTGYVPESEVPALFHAADLVVFPYNENTGASGVLFQTCQFGRVPLLRRLPVFQEMVDDLGLAAYFYETEVELAEQMCELLTDPGRLMEDGYRTFEAIRTLSIDRIGSIYWRLFDGRD
jgi:glycosyltransferase involved in cell wall biosynthesis